LAAITFQRTKYNYVVSELNQQQTTDVADITSQPYHEPYDRLKGEQVRLLSVSRERRLRKLLSHEEMGDRKPSKFLRHLLFMQIILDGHKYLNSFITPFAIKRDASELKTFRVTYP